MALLRSVLVLYPTTNLDRGTSILLLTGVSSTVPALYLTQEVYWWRRNLVLQVVPCEGTGALLILGERNWCNTVFERR